MLTYINRKEPEAAGDYSAPVLIRGRYYRVVVPPVFKALRDTANIEAILLPDLLSKNCNFSTSRDS